MLVLSRKLDQEIVIQIPPDHDGSLIRVVVTDIIGDKVRLGFLASKSVIIDRREIWDRKDGEKGAM